MTEPTDRRRSSELTTLLGVVLGGALGGATALAVGSEAWIGLAFGGGGGILVGSLVGAIADYGGYRARRQVLATSAFLGALVGAGVGAVGAWTVGGPLRHGVALGTTVGGALGGAIGVVLVTVSDGEELQPRASSNP